ncbi:hypothetical protein AVEN_5691-1 [Araneus ventricosus]|uniref:Uncharacterized protein n=1 Tax=Araneus ventricosus TaxID=182803 RepID=A0A4Y2DV21_ARAVE|nr:hypothetical protein AVEN_5691-1 [Araneus ventricosus]
MYHWPACATGGPHLDVPSGGMCNRWLALRCSIGRHVKPVAHTSMACRAAGATGDSHLDGPGAYHLWLALRCPIRRCVPSVACT